MGPGIHASLATVATCYDLIGQDVAWRLGWVTWSSLVVAGKGAFEWDEYSRPIMMVHRSNWYTQAGRSPGSTDWSYGGQEGERRATGSRSGRAAVSPHARHG